MAERDITQREIPLLAQKYNFTDGHAYRPHTPAEQEIFDRLGTMYRETMDRSTWPSWQEYYLEAFFDLSGQSRPEWIQNYFLLGEATRGIELIRDVIKTKFRRDFHLKGDNHASVAMIEPVFDNLPNTLKIDLELESVPASWLSSDQEFQNIYNIRSAVIFLCVPNNPTGTTLSRENYIKLLDFCRENQKILVLDNCFRFFLPPELVYDQYGLAAEHEVHVMMLEDTGKTWPTTENKVSILTASGDREDPESLAHSAYDFYSNMYLTMSPIKWRLLGELMRLSANDNFVSIKEPIAQNLRQLEEFTTLLGFHITSPPFMSVAWLDTGTVMPGTEFIRRADEIGVHALGGERFFWDNPGQGENNIRFALNKDPKAYLEAMARLRNGFQP